MNKRSFVLLSVICLCVIVLLGVLALFQKDLLQVSPRKEETRKPATEMQEPSVPKVLEVERGEPSPEMPTDVPLLPKKTPIESLRERKYFSDFSLRGSWEVDEASMPTRPVVEEETEQLSIDQIFPVCILFIPVRCLKNTRG